MADTGGLRVDNEANLPVNRLPAYRCHVSAPKSVDRRRPCRYPLIHQAIEPAFASASARLRLFRLSTLAPVKCRANVDVAGRHGK